MFVFLKNLVNTQDGLILFLFSCIAGAMVIDFLLGTIAAKVNPDIKFASSKGINGILRKMGSIITLVFFIPLSILVPNDMGVPLLYSMYMGYLLFELTSIFENLEKLGIEITIFKKFAENLKKKENDNGNHR